MLKNFKKPQHLFSLSLFLVIPLVNSLRGFAPHRIILLAIFFCIICGIGTAWGIKFIFRYCRHKTALGLIGLCIIFVFFTVTQFYNAFFHNQEGNYLRSRLWYLNIPKVMEKAEQLKTDYDEVILPNSFVSVIYPFYYSLVIPPKKYDNPYEVNIYLQEHSKYTAVVPYNIVVPSAFQTVDYIEHQYNTTNNRMLYIEFKKKLTLLEEREIPYKSITEINGFHFVEIQQN